MTKLKVGIIADKNRHSSLLNFIVNESNNSEKFSIECVILQDIPKTDKSLFKRLIFLIKTRGLRRFLRDLSFKCLEYGEFKLLKIFTNLSYNIESNQSLNIINSITVRPHISESGFFYTYNEDDCRKIADAELDILIRAGSGILRGEILTLCKFGILSFHHGDNDVNRGGPPAFWEVYNKESSTGFIIQKLNHELDGGQVLFKGSIGTSFIYSLNYYRLMNKASVFMIKTLNQIANKNELPDPLSKNPYSGIIYSTPKIYQQFKYFLVTSIRVLGKLYDFISRKGNRWAVAYQFSETWDDVSLRKSVVIKNPPERFYADPFVINYQNKNICFVEDYCFKKSIGRISAIQIDKDSYKDLGIVLEEDFHLSFPYVFKVNDDLYMCPETYQSNEIRLYKCDEFPHKWSFYKTLMKNVSSMDNMIFKNENKWWLMSNIDSSSLRHEGSELHLFYSDAFDSESWQPHDNNPVVFSSDRGRNAGILANGDDIFRVYQKNAFGLYGESMGVAKIDKLSEKKYIESERFKIKPNFFPNILGTHTFSYSDNLLVFDFLKKEKINK